MESNTAPTARAGSQLSSPRPVAAAMALIIGSAHCGAASAARPLEEPGPVTFNQGVYSQYLFRGLTQTNRRPALQAGLEYAAASGLYTGNWLSGVSWFSDANPGVRNSIEWDLYGGYRRPLGRQIVIDTGVIHYGYPGQYGQLPEGTVKPNMTELYVAVSWHVVTVKYSHSVTNANGIEHSVGSNYLDLNFTVPLTSRINGSLHAGRQTVRGQNPLTQRLETTNGGLYSYSDCGFGLVAAIDKSWNASLLYTATTASDAGYLVQGRNVGSPQLALGLVHNF